MFNVLKREVIQEVIDAIELLCVEYDAKEEAKSMCGDDVTFEIGIGFGLRTALRKVRDIKEQYK